MGLPAVAFMLTACSVSTNANRSPLSGSQPSPWFEEYTLAGHLVPDGRYVVNIAGEYDPARPDHVVFFALPNGNSIEWTAGCTMTPDLDWHHDIQHIAAQTRYLREHHGDDNNIVLIYLEANGKSWPGWRRKEEGRDALIPSMLDDVWPRESDTTWTLTGHSGGGSLSFGYLNALEQVPEHITRIAFLDSNYAFAEEEGHAAKLARWLEGDEKRVLSVLAYEDREITFNGRKVVSDTGGTFRATLERMVPAFEREGLTFKSSDNDDWMVRTAMSGQVDFRVHRNPENKILHTVMVGEMNGFVHAMTLPRERIDDILKGERLYTEYVQPLPYDFKVSTP